MLCRQHHGDIVNHRYDQDDKWVNRSYTTAFYKKKTGKPSVLTFFFVFFNRERVWMESEKIECDCDSCAVVGAYGQW